MPYHCSYRPSLRRDEKSVSVQPLQEYSSNVSHAVLVSHSHRLHVTTLYGASSMRNNAFQESRWLYWHPASRRLAVTFEGNSSSDTPLKRLGGPTSSFNKATATRKMRGEETGGGEAYLKQSEVGKNKRKHDQSWGRCTDWFINTCIYDSRNSLTIHVGEDGTGITPRVSGTSERTHQLSHNMICPSGRRTYTMYHAVHESCEQKLNSRCAPFSFFIESISGQEPESCVVPCAI